MEVGLLHLAQCASHKDVPLSFPHHLLHSTLTSTGTIHAGIDMSKSENPLTFRGKDEKGIQDLGGTDAIPAYVDVDEQERRDSVSVGGVKDLTHRKLKPRHIQLIGIGGTIGTALYVQIGRGLLAGGPASLFIAFTIW